MKKVFLSLAVVALLAACGAENASKEGDAKKAKADSLEKVRLADSTLKAAAAANVDVSKDVVEPADNVPNEEVKD